MLNHMGFDANLCYRIFLKFYSKRAMKKTGQEHIDIYKLKLNKIIKLPTCVAFFSGVLANDYFSPVICILNVYFN